MTYTTIPRETTIPRNCEQCGAEFQARLSKVKKGQGRFCSHQCRGHFARRPLAQRLWERVTVTEGCWFYTGCIHPCGYGQIVAWGKGGARLYTHVAAYLLAVGPIPEGMEVCHDCDKNYPPGDITYRRCVRPDHLFLGTRAENAADMVRKHRNPVGEQRPASKLLDAQVVEIRRLLQDGETPSVLARRFGVAPRTVRDILNGVSWRHLLP